MKKNLNIELMRYLMIIAVAILHFGEDYCGIMRTLKGGAIGVDFFFIIGGFYLAQHYYMHQTNEEPVVQANKYFFGRFKRMYPPYLISVLIFIFLLWQTVNYSAKWLINHLYETKWQFLMIHFLNPNMPYDMRSIWYISPFMFLIYVLYFFLAYNRKLAMGLLPVLSIITYSHIYATYGTVCIQGAWEGWLYGGTIRGFAGMAMGIFLYGNVYYCQKNEIVLKSFASRLMVTVIKWASLILILLQMHWFAVDVNDFVKLFLFVVFIRMSYYNCFEINIPIINKIISWLGSINYWIFLLHLSVSFAIVRYLPGQNYYFVLVLYLVSITAVASLFRFAEIKIISFIKKNKMKCLQ